MMLLLITHHNQELISNVTFMKKGIVLIEVLIAAAIFGALLVPILNFFVTGLESNWFAAKEIKSQALLTEQLEALRSVRKRNWEELAVGTYYLTTQQGKWKLIPSATGETLDSFTRKVEILAVYRNQNDQIVAATDPGARLDLSTKKIKATVSWHVLRDRSLTVETYLTRLDNLSWKQTTKAEFDLGEKDMTKTQSNPPTDDGSVILMGGCPSGSPESLIYDDMLRNGWISKCSEIPTFW
jgi:hypothetical protein